MLVTFVVHFDFISIDFLHTFQILFVYFLLSFSLDMLFAYKYIYI